MQLLKPLKGPTDQTRLLDKLMQTIQFECSFWTPYTCGAFRNMSRSKPVWYQDQLTYRYYCLTDTLDGWRAFSSRYGDTLWVFAAIEASHFDCKEGIWETFETDSLDCIVKITTLVIYWCTTLPVVYLPLATGLQLFIGVHSRNAWKTILHGWKTSTQPHCTGRISTNMFRNILSNNPNTHMLGETNCVLCKSRFVFSLSEVPTRSTKNTLS